MMEIRNIVEEAIKKEMPFLAKIKIDSGNFCPTNFITSQLLPYLFFTNTDDNNFRIIPIFLNRKEDITLLPVFYSLALFRNYSQYFLNLKEFKDIEFSSYNAPEIRDLDSKVGRIEAINFSAQNFVIRTGKGQKEFINFNQIDWYERQNRGTGYFRSTEEYFNSISNFNKTFKIRENPLELISYMDEKKFIESNKYQAAVFFTNDLSLLKTDFYRDFTINKKTFFETIPTSIMNYNHPNCNFESANGTRSALGKKVTKMKEFLIFSSFKNYKSFDEIKKTKDWVNTIIFDFTKDLKDLDNVLKIIDSQYKSRLDNGEIKDIYLIFNEKDLDVGYKIIEKRICIYPFLLNYEQKMHFEERTSTDKYKVEQITAFDGNKEFNLLISLAKEFCKEVHIISLYKDLLVNLFEIKTRYYSFYSKESLALQIKILKDFIFVVEENILTNPNYRDKFRQFHNTLELISENLNNEKLNGIKRIFKSSDKVLIVSFNANADDLLNLKKELVNDDISVVNPKDLKHPLNDLNKYDSAYIVNSNTEFRYASVLNRLCNNVTFILTQEEFNKLKSIENSTLIKQFANDKKLLDVLNIQSEDREILSLPTEIQSSNNPKIVEESLNSSELFDLDGFVKNIIYENSNNNIYKSYKEKNTENVVVIFTDETSLTVSKSKYFFIYKENINTLKDCHVQAKELENDDMVFLLRHDSDEFEKLLWEVASLNPELKEYLEKDKKWRIKISDYIIENNMSYHDFCIELENVGFHISSAALSTWIKNDIIEPQGLKKLLYSLFCLNIISETEIDDYLKVIKTVKKLKTRLPYELKKIHVADLNDIGYHTDYEFRELIEKMYRFMDIKTVSLVIK